jgi:hypothetical protein
MLNNSSSRPFFGATFFEKGKHVNGLFLQMRRRQSARDKHNVRKEEIWKKKELLFRAAAPMGSAGAPAASSSSVSRCAKYQQAAPKLNSGGTCKKKTRAAFF